jgi:hypothetical protein
MRIRWRIRWRVELKNRVSIEKVADLESAFIFLQGHSLGSQADREYWGDRFGECVSFPSGTQFRVAGG